jgi:hypothetical protein
MLAQALAVEDTTTHGWLIEGSLVAFNRSDGREALLQMFRTRTGVIADSTSVNDGVTWSPVKDTTVPNPNAKVKCPRDRHKRICQTWGPVKTPPCQILMPR